ncbi:MAG: enoyl-CoA hydratase-related protein [Thaumarchaeota archaeon]|nr:enoyl-CoA hydratase-related protein [Nitrososphaerota archaeon]
MVEGYQSVSLVLEKPLAIIRLNRPEALNALNGKMANELVDALTRLEADDSVHCVILTGSDRAFCAGADVKEMAQMSLDEVVKVEHLKNVFAKAGSFRKPLIGALSGYALGGGLELAMCCDILVASEGTKLGQPEINIGIIPGGGATQRLTRALGKYKAMEMILTGSTISAEEAKAYGLINRVVPVGQCLEEAKKLAIEIALKGPLAAQLAKKAVNESQEIGLSQGLEFERLLFQTLFATSDKDEGMKAFLEKRRPNFSGK